jgi:hypothetical protein
MISYPARGLNKDWDKNSRWHQKKQSNNIYNIITDAASLTVPKVSDV